MGGATALPTPPPVKGAVAVMGHDGIGPQSEAASPLSASHCGPGGGEAGTLSANTRDADQ
ncbi:hypothetical protein [Nonomuraea sp. NPDC050786]|uniref:hypothetical protein n=1 Tax=Nonomuraea sp. NPDC050786 TaxID=3154840 RepID=UPI0034116C16